MKTQFIAASAAVFLASANSYAADAVIYQDQTPIIPTVEQFNWSGFYLGVNGGYSWTRGHGPITIDSLKGGLLGAHIGYNIQKDNFVFGIEGDIAHAWNRRSIAYNPPLIGSFIYGTDWQGSIRARAGVAFDRTLIYGTGGIAFSRVYATMDMRPIDYITERKTLTGWTIGAGIEHAITDNWIIRGEYRYSDFGRSGINLIGNQPHIVEHSVRAGISYKF